MSEDRANEIIKRHGNLTTNRGVWESHWREIADRVIPRMALFRIERTPGFKHTERIFDATAGLALERYAAAVESLICPRNELWHTFEPAAEHLQDDDECKRWCEALQRLVFRYRYMPGANFSSQAHECLLQLGAFGTTGMRVDDTLNVPSMTRSPSPLLYRSQPLYSFWIDEAASGVVDTVHREIKLDARQAMAEYGDKCPDRVKQAADKGSTEKHTYIEAVYPAQDVGPWHWDAPMGAKFEGCVVSELDRCVVREGFYTSNPFAISRNVVSPGEVYGRSPAMTVLPDIKTLNEVSRSFMKATHLAMQPPLLISDDGLSAGLDLTPGGSNYGYVDSSGRPMIVPLNSQSQPNEANELRQDLRQSINSAFLIDLFQILVQTPQMTAYEAALRAQEKGQLLAPTMGRQEAEFLAPIIERELDILWKRGVIQRELPPMPAQLMQSGGIVKIAYTSPLSRLAMQAQVTAVQGWLQDISLITPLDPNAADLLDPDVALSILADGRGVPQRARRSPEALAQVRAQKAQAANVQQAVMAAPQLASAAKDVAAAHQSAQQAPGPASSLPTIA